MNVKKLNRIIVPVLTLFFLSGCVLGRKRADFTQFEKLENQNSTKIESSHDNQMEFPITPGATASYGEKPEVQGQSVTLVLGGAGVASFATVGLLKRFKEEGIKIDSIVASGWPALFALAYGSFKSVHDLEWFAMRLQDQDFSKACSLKRNQEVGELSKFIREFLKIEDLKDMRIPLVIMNNNLEVGDDRSFDSGDWQEPLLRTLAFPGLYRPFPPEESVRKGLQLKALDTAEARKKGNSPVIAVNMYSDYLEYFKVPRKEAGHSAYQAVFLGAFRKSLREELSSSSHSASIELKSSPLDFSKKRAAIFAGSSAASKIIKKLVN